MCEFLANFHIVSWLLGSHFKSREDCCKPQAINSQPCILPKNMPRAWMIFFRRNGTALGFRASGVGSGIKSGYKVVNNYQYCGSIFLVSL